MHQHPELIAQVLELTAASGISDIQPIQTLWSGYGQIVRLVLEHPQSAQAQADQSKQIQSVVVKSIQPPEESDHPRGWNTDASLQRKIESYRVEENWYKHYAEQCKQTCSVPLLYASHAIGNQSWFILEDMDRSYPLRHSSLAAEGCYPCLIWLARFHAHHFQSVGTGLWPTGTYWHLQTRQDEFNTMAPGELKEAAALLDARLNNCQFKTLVHGDAKVANICFPESTNPNDDVALVDFQYTGQGCGIRDVAYFLGSCLDEADCERHAEELLDVYFGELSKRLPDTVSAKVVAEWRSLYAIAWADFHRFLAGWMPEHKKINRYTQLLTRQALSQL